MCNFILIEEETEVQKVLRWGKYKERKQKEKALKILSISLLPLCFRIGLEMSMRRHKITLK
jgi:hypothetical protein